MSTHDYNLANQSGASFRSDLNSALAAILSNNSNASSPSTTVSYSTWVDTSTNKLKIRNTANDDWVDLINLDGTVARDLQFTGASANIIFDQSDNALEFNDNAKATFGTSADLTITHDGSNSIINDAGTGELQLQRAGNTILTLDATGVSIADPDGTGAVRITGFEGSNATLSLICDEGDDNGDTWQLSSRASDNTLKMLNNTSGSLADIWTISTAGDVTQTGHLDLPDSKQIRLGASDDLTIEHNGSNSIINDNGTGELQLQRAGNTILALNADGVSITDPDSSAKLKITGFENSNANLHLIADEGDDNGDEWLLQSRASDNTFRIFNNTAGVLDDKLTITSAGNVGIGITDPTQKLVVSGSGTTTLVVTNTDDGISQLILGNTGSTNLNIQQEGGTTKFLEGGSERMRLTSTGHLMINTTTAQHSETRLTIAGSDHLACLNKSSNSNKSCFQLRNGRASGTSLGTMITFRREDGNTVGSVKCTTTATQYNTSSDYRLKENVIAISDGITRLKTLKPYRFNFKDNPNQTVDGFFAHEVTAVPEAVTEEKDAVITQSMIDSGDAPDGEVGDPIYQEMDQSKLVPLLTAALQESILKIETLETKVAALEAA